MSRLVYVCRFDIQSSEAEKFVLKEYKRWIERHYNTKSVLDNFTLDFDGDPPNLSLLPQDHSVGIETRRSEDNSARILKWSYPSDADRSLLWRNEIRIGSFTDSVALEHTISIDSVDFRIAPVRIEIGSPHVIRRICRGQSVRIGEMHVQARSYSLNLNGLQEFLELLDSPLRRLPIVFLAPYTDSQDNLIDENKMSAALAGVAVLVKATSAEVTWEIADVLGRSLSCYDGAARIYWPGFLRNDDPRRHPLYLANRIAAVGAQAASMAIQRAVFSVATFRFVPDARINAIIRTAEHIQRVEQIEVRKADSGADWEKYALDLDADLTVAKSRITELEAENENLRANQKFVFAVDSQGAGEEILPDQPQRIPNSNSEAVAFAENDLENLIILKTALEAAENSPFRRPQEIYDALRDLDIVAREWREQQLATGAGGDLRQHLVNRGWGKRCSLQISETTRKRYRNDYTFEYENKRVLFEPHITIGSGDPNMCASIHFILDAKVGKIVVAHAGRHLPNTKT